MKFDIENEFQVFSQLLKDQFGYELKWGTIIKNNTCRYVIAIYDFTKQYERLVLACEHTTYVRCLEVMYEHISKYGILGHDEGRITLPKFHTARELKMKLSLQGR